MTTEVDALEASLVETMAQPPREVEKVHSKVYEPEDIEISKTWQYSIIGILGGGATIAVGVIIFGMIWKGYFNG